MANIITLTLNCIYHEICNCIKHLHDIFATILFYYFNVLSIYFMFSNTHPSEQSRNIRITRLKRIQIAIKTLIMRLATSFFIAETFSIYL